LSASCAVGFVLFIALRPNGVHRVRTLGSITPSTPGAGTLARSGTTSAIGVTSTTVTTAVSEPIHVMIDKIGVDADVVPVGVEPDTNSVEIPDIARAGWYRYGPSPGQEGSSVLVGHVDGQGLPGVFWRLRNLIPGDRLTIRYADRTERAFRVTGRQEAPKQQLPAALFSRAGPPRLALITCGGRFDQTTRHYRNNVFITATPA
jgi:hypothetical protein